MLAINREVQLAANVAIVLLTRVCAHLVAKKHILGMHEFVLDEAANLLILGRLLALAVHIMPFVTEERAAVSAEE